MNAGKAIITLPADRVEWGDLVQRGPHQVANQTVRLYQGDQCVTVVTLMWPAGVPSQGAVEFVNDVQAGRHGAQD